MLSKAYAEAEQRKTELAAQTLAKLAETQQQATAGDPESLWKLGLHHRLGHGVPQSDRRSRELWGQASRAGSAKALAYLAWDDFHNGNCRKAAKRMSLACAGGFKPPLPWGLKAVRRNWHWRN